MKNQDPGATTDSREKAQEAEDGTRRDDTNRTGDELSRFTKDKRKRITRVEKNPGKYEKPEGAPGVERPERAARPEGYNREGRDYRTERPQRDYGQRDGSPRRDYGDRPQRSYNDRGADSDRPARNYNDRYADSDRPQRSYNERNSDRPQRSYPDRDNRDSRDSRPPRDYRDNRDGRGDRPARSYNNDRPSDRGNTQGGERRSYNPNFTPDNKFRGAGSYNRRPDQDSPREDRFNRADYDGSKGPNRTSTYDRGQSRYQRDDNRPRGNDYHNRRSDSPGRPYDQRGGRPQGGGFKPRGDNAGWKKPQPRYDSENYPKYPREEQQEEVRLNRYLSMSGICSRREADQLIAAGQVTVNGVVTTEMGSKVRPGDEVKYNDKVIKGESKVYIVMNKPKGFVTSLDDPHAEKTVIDIIKNAVKERVYPVGRLDKNSLGVLLITNDGDMTKKLTHPSFEKKKIYQVTLDKNLTPEDRKTIAEGIELEDGFIRADNIDYVKDDPREIGIEIHSGRNRIVRRIFEHMGYQVKKLDRVYFAGLTKKNLKRGAWRFLTGREVAALHSNQYE